MVYEGGVIGSPLSSLLSWTVSSERDEDRPWDQMRFFRLLTDMGVPKSLYGEGKYKLANVASKPIPIAVVKKRLLPQTDRENGGGDPTNDPPEKRWKHLF